MPSTFKLLLSGAFSVIALGQPIFCSLLSIHVIPHQLLHIPLELARPLTCEKDR